MKFFSKIKESRFLIFLKDYLYRLVSPWTPLAFLLIIAVYVMLGEGKYISELLGVSNKEAPKNEVLKIIGILMGGILVTWQAWASHKRAKTMEETASHTEQGLRQERLKNAIEHLGNEKDTVRLGGAYELFHLAEDTEDLRQTALDMLCLHIRQTTGEYEYQEKHKSKPSEEVQSLLTLLFVQEHKVFKGLQINLQRSWLNGADLREARLEKAILTEVRLQGAKLWKARLKGTDLFQAHLQGAFLTWAHLQEANLTLAYLQEANLWWAYLQGVDLNSAHLQRADLRGTYLQGANLSRAYLQGANLSEAHLLGVDLSKAHLQGASLDGARLQGASLDEAYLQGATSLVWLPTVYFKDRIQNRIGKETDLSDAICEGGLSREDLDFLLEGLSEEKANELREKLEPHIGKPVSNELPEDSDAITGTYTVKEAEEWIAKHEKAMSEVPRDGS